MGALAVCAAVVEDRLIIATNLPSLREAAAFLKEKGKGIAEDPDFKEALGRLNIKGRATVEYWRYTPSAAGESGMLGALALFGALGASEGMKARRRWGGGGEPRPEEEFLKDLFAALDFSRYPPPRDLAKHRFSAAEAAERDAGGIAGEAYFSLPVLPCELSAGSGAAAALPVLAAIAIPSLLRSRVTANEASAISSMRTIATSEQSYKTTQGDNRFASLQDMSGQTPPFVDSVLGAGLKSGYRFEVVVDQTGQTFTARASPVTPGKTGRRYFWTDTSGVIRAARDKDVDDKSPPID